MKTTFRISVQSVVYSAICGITELEYQKISVKPCTGEAQIKNSSGVIDQY